MRWELDCEGKRVDEPTQDDFPGKESTVSLPKILHGSGLLSVWVVGVGQGSKYLVQTMQ
jgi:hypothetical protein